MVTTLSKKDLLQLIGGLSTTVQTILKIIEASNLHSGGVSASDKCIQTEHSENQTYQEITRNSVYNTENLQHQQHKSCMLGMHRSNITSTTTSATGQQSASIYEVTPPSSFVAHTIPSTIQRNTLQEHATTTTSASTSSLSNNIFNKEKTPSPQVVTTSLRNDSQYNILEGVPVPTYSNTATTTTPIRNSTLINNIPPRTSSATQRNTSHINATSLLSAPIYSLTSSCHASFATTLQNNSLCLNLTTLPNTITNTTLSSTSRSTTNSNNTQFWPTLNSNKRRPPWLYTSENFIRNYRTTISPVSTPPGSPNPIINFENSKLTEELLEIEKTQKKKLISDEKLKLKREKDRLRQQKLRAKKKKENPNVK